MTTTTPDPMSQQFASPPVGSAPDGYAYHDRYAIVRLGPELRIHTDANHASVGVTRVEEDAERRLVVYTDCRPGELIVRAVATPDDSLAEAGLRAGVSGGGYKAVIPLRSNKRMQYDNGAWAEAETRLRPRSTVFDSDRDNLWVHIVTLRPVSS